MCVILTKLSSNISIRFRDVRAKLAKTHYKKISAKKASVESKFLSVEDSELITKFME